LAVPTTFGHEYAQATGHGLGCHERVECGAKRMSRELYACVHAAGVFRAGFDVPAAGFAVGANGCARKPSNAGDGKRTDLAAFDGNQRRNGFLSRIEQPLGDWLESDAGLGELDAAILGSAE
jgi:hypothetical protein